MFDPALASTLRGVGSPPSGHRADVLAGAIATIGTDRFGQALMAIGRQWFGAVQLVGFHFGRSSACSTVIAENMLGDGDGVRALAESYRAFFLNDDPNVDAIGRQEGGAAPILCRSVRADHIGAAAYREMLFEKPRLAGKIALMARRQNNTLYLNFYRGIAQAPFEARDVDKLSSVSSTLLALVDRHLTLKPAQAAGRPTDEQLIQGIALRREARLSAREQHLCALLLKGHSIRSAADLLGISANSAVSYRRRAFLKLDIEKQKDLFSLAIDVAHR